MRSYSSPRIIFAVPAIAIAFLFAALIAQTPQPSPTPSPTPSPSVSPTASPSASPTPSPTPLPGAQNFHQWGSITVFNGLPSDSVRAIAQTRDGVMWFGTDNGLARFDGRRVQSISLGDSDASNSILAVEYDDKGVLLVGTRAGAFFSVFDQSEFRPVAGTSSYAITSILVHDRIYFGTDTGLVLLDGASGAEPLFTDPIRAEDGSVARITSLISQGSRSILIASSGGGVISYGDTGVSRFETAPRPLFVNSMIREGTGEVWLGTDAGRGLGGIYGIRTHPRALRITSPTGNVLALDANESGIWAGTERAGLFELTGDKVKKSYTFENTSGGLRSNNIFTLFTDREGVLWIGTNRGVSRFDLLGASQETVSDIPNSNFIRTLYLAPVVGEVFYAGSNRGLFRSSSEGNWIEVPGLRNKAVYAIWARSGSSPIAGTPDGIYDISGRKILDGDVRSLAEFNGRQYAAVFGRGVFDITTDNPQLVYANETVTALAEHPNHLLLGTSSEGLYSFDGKNTKLEIDAATLKSGTIWKLDVTKDPDSIWIGAQHGVFVIRNGSPQRIVAVEDVRDVWVNNEEVWAPTTTRGLIHARRDERFGWLSTSLGFEQGLPSEKAFSILPIEGGFLIGTNRGIVTYRPGEVEPKLLPVRVLGQRVHDPREVASKIDLEYPQNTLLVEVAGQSSRTFPEEFQYAFVLTNSKGEEVARRISNDPQYAPADLTPGDYTIESIAFNRDLLPSEPMFIRFSVAKAPFPWTATALGVLLLLSLVGLVWAVVEHRRIAQRNRELAAARLDLANEAERERRRIARDLHDQTLADLRNLMITSDKIVPDNSEFRNEIEAVSTEIRRICEDLSPSVLENVGLVAALEFLLDRTIENRKFHADESIEDRINFPLNVQLQIYRIAQEVLTNIVRHSDADMVDMHVEIEPEGAFVLSIRDNGRSFQPDGKLRTGRGVSNIRSRANLINGRVSWKESRRGGNVFSLRLEPAIRVDQHVDS